MTDFPTYSRVEDYPATPTLPDPFLMSDGRRVQTHAEWQQRREQIKTMLMHYQFGHMPPPPGNVVAETFDRRVIDDGKAVQWHFTLRMGPQQQLQLGGIITRPVGDGPFPVVLICRRDDRGDRFAHNVLDAVRRGYMVAEYRGGDLQPDETSDPGPARKAYPEHDWGTLAVWSWGGMRVLDYLWTLPEVDRQRVLVGGHSRRGKTALLTGALDERIALTVPNAGGGGGFQCWRFPITPGDVPGVNRHESLAVMTVRRTYWFHRNLKPFAEHPERLPFDQHFLAALVAPRALVAVEAMDDMCGTPLSVQRTYLAARVVYEWLGAVDRIGIHFRQSGGHAHAPEDWAAMLDFADRVFYGKPPEGGRRFDALPYPDADPGFTWQAPVATDDLRE